MTHPPPLAKKRSSVQGRFAAVDPLGASANITSPQSFNRYSYVNNNPINAIDPSGMMLSDIGVYQTSNPEVADILEDLTLAAFHQAIQPPRVIPNPGHPGMAAPRDRDHSAPPAKNVSPTIKNATPEQTALITTGFAEAWRRVQIQPCRDFFGGVDAAQTTLSSVTFTVDPNMPAGGHPQGMTAGTDVLINPHNTSFVNPDGASFPFLILDEANGFRVINLVGVDARAFAQLHEDSHVGDHFGATDSDNGTDFLNNFRNNFKIWINCFSEVKPVPYRADKYPGLMPDPSSFRRP